MKEKKSRFLWLLPMLLLGSTSAAFYLLPMRFGEKMGYFLALLFYWVFWCLLVPVALLGGKGVIDLFRTEGPILGRYWARNLILLSLPLIFAYAYEFPKVVKHANALIIYYSLALAIVNATAEEILWRGTFFRLFGAHSKTYILFSSIGFAIWHFAPQIVYPNKQPGGVFSFVLFAFVLGLMYSTVANDTKSITPIVIAHMLFDFSGLGARLYFS